MVSCLHPCLQLLIFIETTILGARSMKQKTDLERKLAWYKAQNTLFPHLTETDQRLVEELTRRYRLTFQEFRQLVEMARDLAMWREGDLFQWWQSQAPKPSSKEAFLAGLRHHVNTLRASEKIYPPLHSFEKPERESKKITVERADKKIHGMCPVASEKYVCCNLRTIDVVENCVFGCSYCTIQTFYTDKIVFDADLPQKLKSIPIDPDRYYHYGTGQSSDSLAWGNRFGILDALCSFAEEHPNVLLEFKTKSNNIRYFLEHEVPPNIVCSWSLNPPVIIENEEHFTASLEERLAAARTVADRGIKVAFHFHPMVYYNGWKTDYPAIAARLLECFSPQEVLFVSFGSVTLIKPVIRKIRELGHPTKAHQMELVPDPHGKLTYPDAVKISLFRTMHQAFAPWHGHVFFYLCMEKAAIWEQTFGFAYPDNETFERHFLEQAFAKIYPHHVPAAAAACEEAE